MNRTYSATLICFYFSPWHGSLFVWVLIYAFNSHQNQCKRKTMVGELNFSLISIFILLSFKKKSKPILDLWLPFWKWWLNGKCWKRVKMRGEHRNRIYFTDVDILKRPQSNSRLDYVLGDCVNWNWYAVISVCLYCCFYW